MDPKAAAKSKRSQSQQGKRNHPTPSAASARSQKKKKEPLPQQKQHENQGEQKVRADFRALPSNWDRYEENGIEADSEGVPPPPLPAARSISGDAETVAKKSRGADFGRLIADARSLIRDRDHGDIMSSLAIDFQFDEATPDLGSLVWTRRDSLLSRCNNDYFSVDLNAGSSFEVPFLSLDLHSLAAQISKVSLAERLFIEEDFLPTEPVSLPLTPSRLESPEKVDRVNNSPQTGVESQPLCQSSVLAESSVDDLLADIDDQSSGPTPDGHVEHGPTLSSLKKVDRAKKSPKTSVESQPLYPSSVLAESSVDIDFQSSGPTPDGLVEHGSTLSSLKKVDRVKKSPKTGVDSRPLYPSSVIVESSVDDLLADIEFPSGGPSPDGHSEHGPTFSSLTKVDRVKKPPKTGVESQPLYPSSVVVESSVDDLIADFDFLTTGPTSDGHVENGPTFSSLNESIDDLLSETSFDMGLEKQNPGGKFYEHLSL